MMNFIWLKSRALIFVSQWEKLNIIKINKQSKDFVSGQVLWQCQKKNASQTESIVKWHN